jgi:hypothetical protein
VQHLTNEGTQRHQLTGLDTPASWPPRDSAFIQLVPHFLIHLLTKEPNISQSQPASPCFLHPNKPNSKDHLVTSCADLGLIPALISGHGRVAPGIICPEMNSPLRDPPPGRPLRGLAGGSRILLCVSCRVLLQRLIRSKRGQIRVVWERKMGVQDANLFDLGSVDLGSAAATRPRRAARQGRARATSCSFDAVCSSRIQRVAVPSDFSWRTHGRWRERSETGSMGGGRRSALWLW